MIDKIPTWAPVVTATAAVCAATIAYRAFAIARKQLAAALKNQRETTAKTNFREFLKLCVEHPQFAYGRLPKDSAATAQASKSDDATKDNPNANVQAKNEAKDAREQYEWFVAHFLWAAEEILEFAPKEWEENLRLHVEYHREYLEKDTVFRSKDFETYTQRLQDFVDETLALLRARDSAVAQQQQTGAPH